MRVLVEPAKVGVIIFVASILQVTLFSSVEILGGQAVADGFRWMRVRLPNQTEGWVVAGVVVDP